MILVGLGMLAGTGYGLHRVLKIRTWPQVDASVTKTGMTTHIPAGWERFSRQG